MNKKTFIYIFLPLNLCKIVKVFTYTFEQFNASLQNKSVNSSKTYTDLKKKNPAEIL